MLTFVAPLIAYLMSFPVMFFTLFKVEVGILFFITLIPIVAVMKKIVDFPGGNNITDFLLIAMVIGWFLKVKRERKRIFKRSPLNVVITLIIVSSIISLLQGYMSNSFSPDIEILRLKEWKNYMILPLLYFISINNIEKDELVKWVVICISFTMLAMDLNFYSTFRWLKGEHYSDSVRISGAFRGFGPNEMGMFYAMYTFLLLGISYFIENKKIRYFMLFVCACNFYPILYSFSRSGYMCTLAGILTLGILKDRRMIVLFVVLIIFYRILLPDAVIERIDMTFLGKEEIGRRNSAEIRDDKYESSVIEVGSLEVDTVKRKELWEKAMKYFKEYPLMGIGFDTFRHLEGWITHSIFLKILAEEGLLGMIIFIIFEVAILKRAYKLYRSSAIKFRQGIGLGLFTCVIVNLVGGISGDISLYYNLMAINWLFIGIMESYNAQCFQERISTS